MELQSPEIDPRSIRELGFRIIQSRLTFRKFMDNRIVDATVWFGFNELMTVQTKGVFRCKPSQTDGRTDTKARSVLKKMAINPPIKYPLRCDWIQFSEQQASESPRVSGSYSSHQPSCTFVYVCIIRSYTNTYGCVRIVRIFAHPWAFV